MSWNDPLLAYTRNLRVQLIRSELILEIASVGSWKEAIPDTEIEIIVWVAKLSKNTRGCKTPHIR